MSLYQYGNMPAKDGTKLLLLSKLVHQWLKEPTFDQLRTKESLGYVVWALRSVTRDVQQAYFLI